MITKEYIDFMYNKDNIHNCEKCPENIKCPNWQDRLPCGQWHCWVDLSCKNAEQKNNLI